MDNEKLLNILNNQSGDELAQSQKDLTLVLLQSQNAELQRRIDEQEALMNKQFASLQDKISKVASQGPINSVSVRVCCLLLFHHLFLPFLFS